MFERGESCGDLSALQASWVTRPIENGNSPAVFGAAALQSYRDAPLPPIAVDVPASLREHRAVDHMGDELDLALCFRRMWKLPDGRTVEARPASIVFVYVSRIPPDGGHPRVNVSTVRCTEDALDDILKERLP